MQHLERWKWSPEPVSLEILATFMAEGLTQEAGLATGNATAWRDSLDRGFSHHIDITIDPLFDLIRVEGMSKSHLMSKTFDEIF
jgi:hypothetical protein